MAMAYPSPSPSGSSSRRLSEVLSEQQEPFSLDLYLLEKGCSPAFLDAAACGSGACSTCWPGTSSTTGRTLRRPARRKKGSRGSGVLRLLLSKILSGVTNTKAPPAAAKKPQQPAKAIDWRRVDEKQRTPVEQLKQQSLPSPHHAVDTQRLEDDADGEQEEEDEEDEASKKQLSPVSVLEQSLFEHSPPPPHAQRALAIFNELLEAAYTPSSLLDLLAHASKDYRSVVVSTSRSKDGGPMPKTTPRAMKKKKDYAHAHAQHAHRGEEEDEEDTALLEEELGRATALVASELGGARAGAADLRASAQDVGAAVAAAVLEALTEETAAELLVLTMGMDHDCAVDTAARCC